MEAWHMKVLKLVATMGSMMVLTILGATSAYAQGSHGTTVSGIEVHATWNQGTFTGTAYNGVWGAWTIVVNHTDLDHLDTCGYPSYPCAQISGGSFRLAATSPSVELITGSFVGQGRHTGGIVPVRGYGANCTTQLFHITDALRDVGSGSQHLGTGSFDAYLWHYRTWVWGRCITYSATVKGYVTLNH
jgi:hypothetical protein